MDRKSFVVKMTRWLNGLMIELFNDWFSTRSNNICHSHLAIKLVPILNNQQLGRIFKICTNVLPDSFCDKGHEWM